MVTSDIWTDFDPNLDVPPELKNIRISTQSGPTTPDNQSVINIQTEYLDDNSDLDEDGVDTVLDTPASFVIISQTIHTAADGSQAVDVVIDVDEVPGAIDYNIRISRA